MELKKINMCGITGIVTNNSVDYKIHLNKMINKLNHRGPDDVGRYFFQKCCLGHTRLKIIDLETGGQPMLSDCRNKAIIFNGEIYDYKKIREKYKHEYNFHSNSDTEVLLMLYKKYQHNMFDYINGMYAFAIWDQKKEELFCARDRFGEKPFYYAFGKNDEFVFASEIKAIIESGLIDPVIDKFALAHFMQKLYISPNSTIYKNIYTLSPAQYLIYNNGKLKIKRYWDIPKTVDIGIDDAIYKFKVLFQEAIKRQMVADVPVGVFLSGGIDSSAVVSMASKYKQKITTISFGFNNNYSELEYARLIADKYKTNHIEINEKSFDIASLIIKMQNVYDEPFADSSNIPTYLISQQAAKNLKVILSGDGSDELLGGYDYWYSNLLYQKKVQNISLFELIYNFIFRFGYYKHFKKGLDLQRKHKTLFNSHLAQVQFFSKSELFKLGIDIIETNSLDTNSLNDILHYDTREYLPGDILVKTDRAAMANSLEIRTPFLDKYFASFCLSLPINLKITEKKSKLILKKSFEHLLPQEIINRKKQGFGAPVHEWLKEKKVKELVNEYLIKKQNKIWGLLDYKVGIQYTSGYKLWILLNLSIWLENNNFNMK